MHVERFGRLFSPGDKQWDIALAQVTITDKRAANVDFSVPYLDADQGILLRKGLLTRPATVADLRQLQLCTQRRTTAEALLASEIQPALPPMLFDRQAVLFQQLLGRSCDAAVLDAPILGAERAQLPDRYGPLAGRIATGERYGIVLPEGQPAARRSRRDARRSARRRHRRGSLAQVALGGSRRRARARRVNRRLVRPRMLS